MPSSHVRYKQSTQRGEKNHPEQQKVPNFKLLLHPPPCWVCAFCVYPTPNPCPPGVSSSVLSNEPRCKVSSPPQNNSRLPSKENPQNSDAKKSQASPLSSPRKPLLRAGQQHASHCIPSPRIARPAFPPSPPKRGDKPGTPPHPQPLLPHLP